MFSSYFVYPALPYFRSEPGTDVLYLINGKMGRVGSNTFLGAPLAGQVSWKKVGGNRTYYTEGELNLGIVNRSDAGFYKYTLHPHQNYYNIDLPNPSRYIKLYVEGMYCYG